MKTPSSRITRLTRAVLPAAPLTLVALPAAKAQIIYTDPTPITIDSTGSVVLYIGTGASTDTDFFVGPVNPRRTPGYTMYLAFWNQGVQGSNAPYVWPPTYYRPLPEVSALNIYDEMSAYD